MSSIRHELTNIYTRRGLLNEAVVLEEATPEDSPLHPHFEWDDPTAAHEYRLHQAGQMIRAARVTVDVPEGPVKIRAFINVPGQDGGASHYVPYDQVKQPNQQLVLQKMRRELAVLTRRYKHLDEFWQLLDQTVADQAA